MERMIASLHGSRRCEGMDNASIAYDASILLFDDSINDETGHWFPDIAGTDPYLPTPCPVLAISTPWPISV